MIPTHEELFDLSQTEHSAIFDDIDYVWEVIPRIQPYIEDHLNGRQAGEIHPTAIVDDNVDIGIGTVVGPHAVIKGPTIIGANCEIRPGAYIRGNALIGNHVVIGNSTEVKNAFFFNYAIAPHFNYIGDSILGYKSHLGGGASTANFKGDGSEITVTSGDQKYDTGLTKLGALIGDFVEIGGNTLLNPGTIIGKSSLIYPAALIRGVIPSNVIVKVRQTQEIVEKI